jgi:hypothetical protein
MDKMNRLERHLLKGAITIAGFLAVLAAIGNLKETTREIGERKVEESRSRKTENIPTYPAAVPPPSPALTVPLSEAEMRMIQEARAKQQADQERKLLSPECQFWWQQNDLNPSDRAAQMKAKHCR